MLRMSRIFNFLKKRIKFFEKSVKIPEMFKLFRKLFSLFNRLLIVAAVLEAAGGEEREVGGLEDVPQFAFVGGRLQRKAP